jgi:hypothetical protein
MDPAAFKRDFAKVEPLALEEWPSLDRKALAATEGEVEKVVALVADATPHTKPIVRAKLSELLAVATRESNGAADALGDSFHAALDRIEKRVAKLSADAKASALPAVKAFAKDHLLLTLLVVLGFGFLLGRALTPRGRRDV